MRGSRGFTLLELLVVMGIMGLLGTAAVGGYRAMVRGMEERGVMQNVNSFVRAAYQRAQVDRQPVFVYFWNETITSKTQTELETVVGKAVAVRCFGRISRKDGNVLVDEFGDLDKSFMSPTEESGQNGGSSSALMDLYALDDLSDGGAKHSLVRPQVVAADENVQFLGGPKSDESDTTAIPAFGFVLEKPNGVSWKQGTPYGFEFLRLELPKNYIFGNNHSANAGNPVVDAGRLIFDAGLNTGSGLNQGGVVGQSSTIDVSALRQNGMMLQAVKVDTSDPPDRRM